MLWEHVLSSPPSKFPHFLMQHPSCAHLSSLVSPEILSSKTVNKQTNPDSSVVWIRSPKRCNTKQAELEEETGKVLPSGSKIVSCSSSMLNQIQPSFEAPLWKKRYITWHYTLNSSMYEFYMKKTIMCDNISPEYKTFRAHELVWKYFGGFFHREKYFMAKYHSVYSPGTRRRKPACFVNTERRCAGMFAKILRGVYQTSICILLNKLFFMHMLTYL